MTTTLDTYCLPESYQIRENPRQHDDRPFTDQWQREVYEHARTLTKPGERVLDLGCGSGYKLVKHFWNTVGVELDAEMVAWLQAKYPDRPWRAFHDGPMKADVVICADVIEHAKSPGFLLDWIEMCLPRLVVVSTPRRDPADMGPPENTGHVREWSFSEFSRYLRRRWRVVEHFVSNHQQRTQVAVCEVS